MMIILIVFVMFLDIDLSSSIVYKTMCVARQIIGKFFSVVDHCCKQLAVDLSMGQTSEVEL